MVTVTFGADVPQNYRDAVDDLLENSPTFNEVPYSIRITANPEYAHGAPAYEHGGRINIHPHSGITIDGRVATLQELIAHEVGHIGQESGLRSVGSLRSNEIEAIQFANKVRTDLGLSHLNRTDITTGTVGDSVDYIDFYVVSGVCVGKGGLNGCAEVLSYLPANGHITGIQEEAGQFIPFSGVRRDIQNGDHRYATGTECFGPETPIDMWPLDPEFAPDPANLNKIFDQDAVRAKIWKKPIAMIRKGDIVVSFEKNDNLMPGRVTRTFENESKILLDFFGTRVTPGHVYFRPDSKKTDKFECLLDILRDDGMIQNVEGNSIRAATNVPVGDPRDGFVWAITQGRKDGIPIEKERGRIRLATPSVRQYNSLDVFGANL